MPSVAWSRGRNIHDNEPELKRSDSFGAFAAELDHDRAARKEGAAYFCGPFNHDGKRSKDNVEATRFLVFDIDGCPPDVLPDLRMWFAQYEGIGWPTHSSTAAEPHERAVMHLVRAVSREEALQLGQAISRYLADSFPGPEHRSGHLQAGTAWFHAAGRAAVGPVPRRANRGGLVAGACGRTAPIASDTLDARRAAHPGGPA